MWLFFFLTLHCCCRSVVSCYFRWRFKWSLTMWHWHSFRIELLDAIDRMRVFERIFLNPEIIIQQQIYCDSIFIPVQMLPESFLLDSLVRINHERNSLKINKFNENSPMVSSNESLSDVPMCKFSERRLNEASHKQILNTTPPPETKIKRELGFLNKCKFMILILIHAINILPFDCVHS